MFRNLNWNNTKSITSALDSDDVLDGLGLMRKSNQTSWLWPALGGIGFGLLCGVAVGFAFAPRRGSELREEMADKLKNRDFRGIAESARNAFGTEETYASNRMPGRSGTTI